jgi:2-oxoglutarate ferredoxin oxidoreductase subunit alpha
LGGFRRYADVDGDGIPYRTLPGTAHPSAAYFARGSGHNEAANYTEREDDYMRNVDRLARKFDTMRAHVPAPERKDVPGAKIGLVCCGTSRYAMEESCVQLREEYGVEAASLRLKAYPFTQELDDFTGAYDRVYVIDQNRDAQLLALMRLDINSELNAKLRSVRYYGGMPIDARTVTDEIIRQEAI